MVACQEPRSTMQHHGRPAKSCGYISVPNRDCQNVFPSVGELYWSNSSHSLVPHMALHRRFQQCSAGLSPLKRMSNNWTKYLSSSVSQRREGMSCRLPQACHYSTQSASAAWRSRSRDIETLSENWPKNAHVKARGRVGRLRCNGKDANTARGMKHLFRGEGSERQTG